MEVFFENDCIKHGTNLDISEMGSWIGAEPFLDHPIYIHQRVYYTDKNIDIIIARPRNTRYSKVKSSTNTKHKEEGL